MSYFQNVHVGVKYALIFYTDPIKWLKNGKQLY